MARKPLTDVAIKQLRLAKNQRRDLLDGRAPGLMLRCTGKGARTWSLLFRVRGEGGTSANGRPKPGKLHRATLGHYPALSIADARLKAIGIVERAKAGDNPIQRNLPSESEPFTVKRLFARFVEEYAQPNLLGAAYIKRCLEGHIEPKWGNLLADSISEDMAADLLAVVGKPDAKARRGGPGAAHDVRKWGGRAYSWAKSKRLVAHNPFTEVRLDIKSQARERVLSMAELRAVWRAAGDLCYPFGPLVRLLILTGQRREEIGSACWAWLNADEKLLTVPADQYKTNRAHVIPLSDVAWEMVAALPRWANPQGDYLFTTTGGARPVSGWSKTKERLDRLSGVADWVIHDLRRTVRTELPRLGVDGETAELLIGHKLGGIRGVYDRYQRLTERRQALKLWAQELLRVPAATTEEAAEVSGAVIATDQAA